MRTAVAVFNFLRVEHHSGKSATHTDYKMSVSCLVHKKTPVHGGADGIA